MTTLTGNDEIDQATDQVLMNNFKQCDFQDVIVVVARRHVSKGEWEKLNVQRTLVAEHRPDDLAEFNRLFGEFLP